MFNDLRANVDVRQNYQFWFYLYPTGQPFWTSAAQMREGLARMRQQLDPQRREPALDQMVLVSRFRSGGQAGVADEELYRSATRYAERFGAPATVRDIIAFRHAIAAWNFRTAGCAPISRF